MNKEKRLQELLKEKRISYNDDTKNIDFNRVGGLYDLVQDFFEPHFVVVEIGSCEGSSTELFALTCKYVYAIDPWDKSKKPNSPLELKKAPKSEEKYRKRMEQYSNVHTIKGFSAEEAVGFQDHSVDAVYIDGAHDIGSVRKDINLWLPKIKEGGVICGHDWSSLVVRNGVTGILGEPEKTYKDSSWAKTKTIDV